MSTLLVRALSRFKIQPLGGVFDLSTVELGNIAARLCESSFASGSHSVKTVCKCAQRLEARRKRAISEILTPDKRGPCLSALKRLKFQPPNGDCLSVSTSDDRHELTAIEKGADTLWPSCVPLGHQSHPELSFSVQTTKLLCRRHQLRITLQSKADLRKDRHGNLRTGKLSTTRKFQSNKVSPNSPLLPPPSPSSPSPTRSAQFTWIPSREKKVFSNTQETTTRKENPTCLLAERSYHTRPIGGSLIQKHDQSRLS